jgi:hypothetical protein
MGRLEVPGDIPDSMHNHVISKLHDGEVSQDLDVEYYVRTPESEEGGTSVLGINVGRSR